MLSLGKTPLPMRAQPAHSGRHALLPGPRMVANPIDLDDDQCYLFDTPEGRRYVCTEDPTELAWIMGIDMKELKAGPKPDDLNLIECAEEWSHTGTPQWVCKEGSEGATDDECTIIGESADEIWLACADGAGGDNVECTETDFGVGGGPGILPQDGEKLCVQKKPTA